MRDDGSSALQAETVLSEASPMWAGKVGTGRVCPARTRRCSRRRRRRYRSPSTAGQILSRAGTGTRHYS